MQKFLALALLCGVALFKLEVHAQSSNSVSGIVLPQTIAWKNVTVQSSNSITSTTIMIVLMRNGCWRLEAKQSSSAKILTAVFDGTHFVSNRRHLSPNFDPRRPMEILSQACSKTIPEATEERDGRLCWRYASLYTDKTAHLWVDTQTHFPVFDEITTPDGTHAETRYSLLQLDFANGNSQFFNTNSISPLFTKLLVP